MHYTVLFDAAEAGYRQWWLPVTGLALAAVCVILLRLGKKIPFWTQRSSLWTSIGGAVWFLWSLVMFGSTFSDYLHLRNALTSGKYDTVEGIVTEFVPETESDHEPESFALDGQQFSYSFSTITAGFNQTQSQGGPIREGQRLRLAVVGDEIARVELVK